MDGRRFLCQVRVPGLWFTRLSVSSAGHKQLCVTRRDTSASLVTCPALGKGRPLLAGCMACQLWSRWRVERAPWLTPQSAAKVQSSLPATKRGTQHGKHPSCAFHGKKLRCFEKKEIQRSCN